MKLHKIIFLLFLITWVMYADAQLIPFENEKGKWGYKNAKGEIIVPAKYDYAGNMFKEDLAVIILDDEIGFINTKGKVVIEPLYNDVNFFSEGFASVKLQSGYSWGYIDKTGKEITQYKYQQAEEFKSGMAAVQALYTNKWGFIDNTGKEVIEPQYDFAKPFSEGLAPVRNGNFPNTQWYFIDKTGKQILELKYDDVNPFFDGLAKVHKYEEGISYIDKTGKVVLEIDGYENSEDFSDGLALIQISDPEPGYGFINKKGELVIKPIYNKAFSFSEGLASVCNDEGCGFIDTSGKVIIPLKFEDAGNFRNGIAKVWTADKEYYIDKTGKKVE